MNVTYEILKSSAPQNLFRSDLYHDCIQSCFECASTSWVCADSCLNINDPLSLQDCIRNCLTCAEVCTATAKALISQRNDSDFMMEQLKACAEICDLASKECAKYSEVFEHCSISAKCCQDCLKICRQYLEELVS